MSAKLGINTRSIKGDFIGFTFGNIHSSELGLVRVSEGGRYNQDLLPPLQDKKAQVAGRDGEVYFGSQYGSKVLKVPVAFDNMDEKSLSKLRRLLSNKTPQVLWFDESPYKQWLVKSANAQNFKWLCFDESHNGREKRIYKGEGVLEFICFNSYATSRITFLDEAEYIDSEGKTQLISDFSNIDEWKESSGLRKKAIEITYEPYNQIENENNGEIENGDDEVTIINEEDNNLEFEFNTVIGLKIQNYMRRGILLYNAGDIEIKPQIICRIPSSPTHIQTEDIVLKLYAFENGIIDQNKTADSYKIGELVISKDIVEKCVKHTKQGLVPYLIIDSKLKMMKGAIYNNETRELTGYIYNRYHKSGDYFEIPVSSDDVYFIEISESSSSKTSSESTSKSEVEITGVEYTHKYY